MSDLVIRKIPFRFEGVDFIWNPENPGFSVMMNTISFFAIGLEKYFCLAFRDAEPLIKDPKVLEEARLFRTQEGSHASAHKRHVSALIVRYPGLQEALDQTIESFDKLYEAKDLAYHLGYGGGLESVFTPFFKLLLDNREVLFGKGDSRVASLLLWHFCEEIEHRSSALMVFDHVVGSYFYRVKNYRSYMGHVLETMDMLAKHFQKHVPGVPKECYRKISGGTMPILSSVSLPWRDRMKSTYGIFQSQMPWHNPVHQPLPKYYSEWRGLYDRGKDMTNVFGVSPVGAGR